MRLSGELGHTPPSSVTLAKPPPSSGVIPVAGDSLPHETYSFLALTGSSEYQIHTALALLRGCNVTLPSCHQLFAAYRAEAA